MKDPTRVLRTVGNIHRLLAAERQRGKLLGRICDDLVRNLGYHNAWIVHLDPAGNLAAVADAGLGESLGPVVEAFRRGELPRCARQALQQPEPVVVRDPPVQCPDCPLSAHYAGRGGMACRLEHQGRGYGLLVVSLPAQLCDEDQEPRLFQELCRDIAFGLHGLEVEEQRERALKAFKESTAELGQRVKELNCLYGISDLVERPAVTLEEILDGAARMIPTAMQHPEAARGRVVLGEQVFCTDDFSEAGHRLSAEIRVFDRPAGRVEVCYVGDPPPGHDGPFLVEEHKLIEAVARRLGRVAERMRTRAALLESEKNFRDLVENSLTGILIVQKGRLAYHNPECQRLLGVAPEGWPFVGAESVFEEDVIKAASFFEKALTGTDQTLETEFRFYREAPAGERPEMKWVHCRATRVEYQGSEALLVNLTDVTNAKELERLLRIEDKMSSLGRMTAGIAHEIRNPLSGINIYLNTLEKIHDKPAQVEKVGQILTQLQSASRKIESVIKRVLDFSRASEPRFKEIDVNGPVREALKLSEVTLRKSGITVELSLADDLPVCVADEHMVEEVVVNLLTNAAEAMKGQKEVRRIEVSSSREGDYILVRVADSGPGVPAHMRETVFDPFFTTKGSSTGIGLSICHRIISDHNGRMGVWTSKWGGGEFGVELPVKPASKPKER